jgi:hypothetical protein
VSLCVIKFRYEVVTLEYVDWSSDVGKGENKVGDLGGDIVPAVLDVSEHLMRIGRKS